MTLASSLKITIVLLYHKVSFHTTSSLTDNKDRQQRMALIKELETLIQVGRHPNIVSLVGACTFEGKGSAIQEVTANVGGQVVSIKICVAEMEIRFQKNNCTVGAEPSSYFDDLGKVFTFSPEVLKNYAVRWISINRFQIHWIQIKLN